MQMLCALLIFRTSDLPDKLATLSPWLDMQTRPIDDVLADLASQEHRRFIKTHTPLDGLPFDERVTYVHVARDPRDVALSWDNHMANLDLARVIDLRVEAVGGDDLEDLGFAPPPPPSEDPVERFWRWIEGNAEGNVDDVSGLGELVHHVDTFWDARQAPNVHLFHYGDLRVDLAGQMVRLADALGVDHAGPDLVEAATFEQMRARADELAPNMDRSFWHDPVRFFDKARAGEWREFAADDESRRRYEHAVGALATPELAGWLHSGWLGTAS